MRAERLQGFFAERELAGKRSRLRRGEAERRRLMRFRRRIGFGFISAVIWFLVWRARASAGRVAARGCAGAGGDGLKKCGRRARVHQLVADGVADEIMHKARLAKAHLRLGRMHVDVDLFRRHFEKHQDDRETMSAE